jgi:hypothetical protein
LIDLALGVSTDNADCKEAKARAVVIGGAYEMLTNVFREYLFPWCSPGLLVDVEVASPITSATAASGTASNALPVDDDIVRSIPIQVYLLQSSIDLRANSYTSLSAPLTYLTDVGLRLTGELIK